MHERKTYEQLNVSNGESDGAQIMRVSIIFFCDSRVCLCLRLRIYASFYVQWSINILGQKQFGLHTHTMAQQRSVGSHSQVPPMTLAAAGDSCQSCKAGFFPSVENKPLVWWAPQTSLRPINRFPPCFFITCQCQEVIRVEVIIVVVLPLFVIIIDDEFINCKYECLP